MKKAGVNMLLENKQQIEGNLVLKKGKVYIPKNKVLRVEIIQLHHNILVAKHEGRQKITKLVTRNYWWPEEIRGVRKYINGCDMCQKMKNRIEAPVEKLKLSKISKKL